MLSAIKSIVCEQPYNTRVLPRSDAPDALSRLPLIRFGAEAGPALNSTFSITVSAVVTRNGRLFNVADDARLMQPRVKGLSWNRNEFLMMMIVTSSMDR